MLANLTYEFPLNITFLLCISLNNMKIEVISLIKVKGFESLLFFSRGEKKLQKSKEILSYDIHPSKHSWLLIGNIWGWAWPIAIKLKLPIHTLPF